MATHGRSVFALSPLTPPDAGARAALIGAGHCFCRTPLGAWCLGGQPRQPPEMTHLAPRSRPGVQSCSAGDRPNQRRRAGRAPTPSAGTLPPAAVRAHRPPLPRSSAQQSISSGDAGALPRGGGGRGREGCARLGLSLPPRRPAWTKPSAWQGYPLVHLTLGRVLCASAQVTPAARRLRTPSRRAWPPGVQPIALRRFHRCSAMPPRGTTLKRPRPAGQPEAPTSLALDGAPRRGPGANPPMTTARACRSRTAAAHTDREM